MHHKHLLEAIGNTPLVKVNFNTPASVYAKLEYLNPGGSIKDRSASFMIEEAEKHGLIHPGGTLIDASSGNHAIAVAMIGALKGYKVILCVPDTISKEKLQTIQAYGAKVFVCPSSANSHDNPENYHTKAVSIHQSTPNSFMPNQYLNPVNAQAHYTKLGPEIWKQTEGKITHFFAGAGTGGTASGAGRFLKEQNPNIKIIAVDSANSIRATNGNPKIYQTEGIGLNFPESPVIDTKAIDEIITIHDEEAFSTLKPLAQQHGILAGLSSGAVAYVVQEYLKKNSLSKDNVVVMIFADSGRAYLSKNAYE